MKPIGWIALLGMFVVGGTGFWWVSQRTASPEKTTGLEMSGLETGGAEPSASAPSHSVEERPQLQTLATETDAEEEVRTAVAEALPEVSGEDLAREPIASRHPVRWVVGRVEWPDGVPADESLEVVARGKVFEWDRRGRREHRVAVQRNGQFRVAVAVDSKAASLKLFGKYCYLRRPAAWKASDPEELVLRPQLGASMDVYFQGTATDGPPAGFSAKLSGLRNETHDLNPQWTANNRLELRGLPEGRSFRLVARAEGFGAVQHAFEDLKAGTHGEQTLTFVQEAVIQGDVVDQLGQRVSRGKVQVTQADEDGEYRPWNDAMATQVDVEDGRFVAQQLAAGDYEVAYQGKGYTQSEAVQLAVRAGQSVERTLHLSSGHAIEGKVHWASGEPAAGVKVRLLGGDGFAFVEAEGPNRIAVADAQGAFQFTGFESHEEYGLIAEGLPPEAQVPDGLSKIKRRRWEREHRVLTRAAGVRPGGAPVALVLGLDTGQVHGRVMDDAGQPITRFRVVAVPKLSDDPEDLGAGQQRHRFEDPDGAFVLQGLPAGDWVLRATAFRFKDGEPKEIKIPTQEDVILTLPRAAWIQGQVVDGQGNPVKARVRAERLGELGQALDWSRDNRKSTQATELLGFTLNSLDAGRWRVVAESHPEGQSEPWEGTVAVGQAVEDVVLRLPEPGRLQGSLHADWRQGNMRARARLAEEDGSFGRSETTKVDEEGRFDFGQLPAGEYQVAMERSVQPKGQSYPEQISLNLKQTVQVEANRTANVYFGPRPGDSLILTGRLFEGDKPVPGTILRFRGLRPKRDAVQSFTEDDARYRVVLGGPGRYSVRADANGSERSGARHWTIEVQGRGEVTQDLHLPGGKLRLQPVFEGGGPFSGRIRGGSLSLVGTAGQGTARPARVDSAGIHFEGLAEGTYRLNSRDIEDGGVHYVVLSPETITLRAGDSEQVESIVLGPGCVLVGTVTNPTAENRWIAAYRRKTGGSVVEWARVENGQFRMEGLPPGDVWLEKRGGHGEEEKARIRVQLDRSAPVTITL